MVAASAGNHAQGVALAASMLDTKATIFMPEGAALPKIAATQGYGAEIEFARHRRHGGARRRRGSSPTAPGPCSSTRSTTPTSSPAREPSGLEIMEQVPDVQTIVVPIGGGGLAAGIALLREQHPHVHIVGVQAEDAAAYPGSLAEGHPLTAVMGTTMADGIAVAMPGEIPFGIVASPARRGHHRQRGVDEPGAARPARARQDAGRAVRGCRRWPPCSTAPTSSRGRSSRCCRAATSTRCCCSTSSGTASWPPAASSTCGCGSPTGPAG